MTCKCGANVPFETIAWDYFLVKGYRSKVFKCACGNEPMRCEPFSKEKKQFWQEIGDDVKSNPENWEAAMATPPAKDE